MAPLRDGDGAAEGWRWRPLRGAWTRFGRGFSSLARRGFSSLKPRRRCAQAFATHRFFQQAGFVNVHTPLITTASGAKMGKTAQGAVWLNAELLSPYDYWQFWRNTEDADVGKFLKMFTELPLDEIARLEALQGAEINDAKKVLANAATALLHGHDAAQSAAATAKTAFEEGALAHDLPRVTLLPSAAVLEALIKAGFCASKGEARRLAKGGGVRIDDQPVIDVDQPLSGFARDGALIKVSAGKKKIVQVETLPSA